MSTHFDLYLASRASLDAAQQTFRAARSNLRKHDPEGFRMISAGEQASKSYRSPKNRSDAWLQRREAIERGVIKNWSIGENVEHHSAWDECYRIGEILRSAGLFARNSYAAGTVSKYAIEHGLMAERVYQHFSKSA